MRVMFAIMLVALLSGCAGYSYPVQDGGNGVYFAQSPPQYTYVNTRPYGPYYFNPVPSWLYYSPYQYPNYFAVWSSPLIYDHYRGYGPPRYARSLYPEPVSRYPRYGARPVRFGTSPNPGNAARSPRHATPVSNQGQRRPSMAGYPSSSRSMHNAPSAPVRSLSSSPEAARAVRRN